MSYYKKTVAVIVAYLPNKDIIVNTIHSIVEQVIKIYIIDNTPNGCLQLDEILREMVCHDKIELISLKENLGIAKAQNIGIKKALNENAEFILLSDQDTIYPVGYVERMINTFFKLPNHESIASISPNFVEQNKDGELQGFVVFRGLFSNKIFPASGCYEVCEVIASGQIIVAGTLDKIGLMDEALFIDWVDLEWCWRAKANGYKIIGCADVVIEHTLGDVVVNFASKSYSIRSSIRHYYITRNAVYLALYNKHISAAMRINLLIKCVRYLVGFTALGKPHWKHFTFTMRGLYHGIIKRLGAY
ncbi:hypothetical protein ES703_15435 [subsurface metagenome]